MSLNLGQKDVAALSTSTTARRAYDLISENFGPGVNGPLIVAASLSSPAKGTDDSRVTTLEQDVAHTSGVAATTPAQIDKAGTTASFNTIATTGPAEQATADLVDKLRSSVIPGAEKGTDLNAYVGGNTAANADLAAKISSKLPLQIVVVIALSFLLLMLAFRTVVVPVQAAVMNLLSIGAAYGVLTAIFQFGWLHSLIGLDGSVPIVSYVPLFMFAILFGLSMDYEVFLVSQIQEHVHEGEDTRQSVVKGLIISAEVITAAATIMVFVFGSFVLNGDPTVKQFGIGLAVAVILNATVVRCLLVPARMVALDRKSWYMPHWLDRVVPHINIEGAEFFDRRDRRAPSTLESERQPAVRSAGGDVDHAVGDHISAHPRGRAADSELPAHDGSRDRAQAVQSTPPPGIHPGATTRGSRPVADPANRQRSGKSHHPHQRDQDLADRDAARSHSPGRDDD